MNPSTTASPEEKLLRNRLAQNASEVEARRRLARLSVVEGRVQEAAEHYAHVIKSRPNDVEALGQLAFFYLERGELGLAYSLFQSLVTASPNHRAATYQLRTLELIRDAGEAAKKAGEFYGRIAGVEDGSAALGLKRENIPCLVRLNGDLLWLPGDLVRFLWHTVQRPLGSTVPSFLAEMPHYGWIRERVSAGDDVLDIGSNVGIFATMMAARVGRTGRVFAFEPSAKIASDLRRVLALNELEQVTVVEAAASDRAGTAEFCDVQEDDVRRESSHLNEVPPQQGLGDLRQTSTTVRTLVIDEFVAEHQVRPTLMKIDVEGAEFLVLEGAKRTIQVFGPTLVIEFHPNGEGVFDHAKLAAFLTGFGYEFKTADKTYYCWRRSREGRKGR